MKKSCMTLALVCPLSAFAAHPLVSDDTGTQGDGNWQFESNGEVTAKQPDTGRQTLWNSTLTRGVGEALDLYVNVPYTNLQHRSDSAGSGMGDVEAGAKWRLFDDGALSIGIKPYLTLPSGNDQRGLGSVSGCGKKVRGNRDRVYEHCGQRWRGDSASGRWLRSQEFRIVDFAILRDGRGVGVWRGDVVVG